MYIIVKRLFLFCLVKECDITSIISVFQNIVKIQGSDFLKNSLNGLSKYLLNQFHGKQRYYSLSVQQLYSYNKS